MYESLPVHNMYWLFLNRLLQDLEHECLVPQPSEKLANIALTLLKSVSSHKPLT